MALSAEGSESGPAGSHGDAARLRPFLAELADPGLEAAFQNHHLDKTRAQLRTALYICGFFYLAFFFTDVAALGWTQGALFLFLCRLVVMLSAFAVIQLARRRPWEVVASGYGATAIEIIGMVTFLFIVVMRPNEVAWHSISINLMLMVVYLFIPNRFVFALGVGLVATAAYVGVVIGLQQYTAVEATVMIMLLMLSNTFGAVAAHRYARVRREEYLAFVAEREANARLEQALAERTAAQQEAEQARQRAEYASEAKSQFLAHMSHEIRTPLHGIVGFLDLMAKTPLDSLQSEYLHSSKLSAKSLLSVINDILDFSKIEAGKLELESVPMNLRVQLEEALAIHYGNAHAKGLGVHLLYHHQAPAVLMGDPMRTTQIVSNLVSNAVKFTDKGEILVSVMQAGGDDRTAWMEISVKDGGIGMSAQQCAALFQPFVQGDASTTRRYGGTGLGLVICQRLVALMGGELRVDSALGKGSEFSMRLPFLRGAPVAETPVRAPGPVLVITANAFLAHALREMLSARAVDAYWITSPEEFQAWLHGRTDDAPCHLIVDHSMTEVEAPLHDAGLPGRLLWLCPPDMSSRWQQGLAGHESWLVGLPRAEDVILWLEGGNPVQGLSPNMGKPEHKQGRCLVVDDNDINRRLILILLEQYGLAPEEARDGAEAVMRCRENPYDLVFMDIHMPAMDGMEATRLIRETEAGRRHTPVIALTANAFPGDMERFKAAGMDDVLTKPMKEEQLVNILQRWLPDKPMPTGVARKEAAAAKVEPLVLDEAAGLSTAYGKRDLWLKVLGMLLDSLPNTLAELDEAWVRQDLEGVYKVAHKLNGSTVYCGTPRLRNAAAALEAAGRERQVEIAAACLVALKEEARRLLEYEALPVSGNATP